MADTTFLSKQTKIVTAWAQDVNDTVYGKATAVRNFTQTGTGAVARTTQAKLKEWVSVLDFGATGDGVTDDTGAVNTAIAAGDVRFTPGTYNLTGDIIIPANRKILVDRGATLINNGGRFTAYDVDNVHIHVEGKIQSVSMTTGLAKAGWPSIAGGSAGDERGFIEFGSASTTSPRANFSVTGTGIISGDWTGTAGAPSAADLNRKGIAIFNSKNIVVRDVEVFGFRGEAVYSYGISANCLNWLFESIFSHDSHFNALNFNAVGPITGLRIRNCLTINCYAGIETSVGEVADCEVVSPLINGIWTGNGSGTGPITIKRNRIRNAGALSIYTVFNSSVIGPVEIEDNLSYRPNAGSFQMERCSQFACFRNKSNGHGQTTNAYAFAFVSCMDGVIDQNVMMKPGPNSLGSRFIDSVTSPVCTDISIGRDYVPLNTGALPIVGGGFPAVVSAATLILPDDTEMVSVSGSVTITNIATGSTFAGRRVTLVFQAALTVTDGGNLKLAGNFVTTADDSLSLVSDGASWYETGRSVN